MWMFALAVFGLIGVAYIVGGFRISQLSRAARERRRIVRIRERNAMIDTLEERCECGDPSCGLDVDQLPGGIFYTRNVPNDEPFLDPSAAEALRKRTLH